MRKPSLVPADKSDQRQHRQEAAAAAPKPGGAGELPSAGAAALPSRRNTLSRLPAAPEQPPRLFPRRERSRATREAPPAARTRPAPTREERGARAPLRRARGSHRPSQPGVGKGGTAAAGACAPLATAGRSGGGRERAAGCPLPRPRTAAPRGGLESSGSRNPGAGRTRPASRRTPRQAPRPGAVREASPSPRGCAHRAPRGGAGGEE